MRSYVFFSHTCILSEYFEEMYLRNIKEYNNKINDFFMNLAWLERPKIYQTMPSLQWSAKQHLSTHNQNEFPSKNPSVSTSKQFSRSFYWWWDIKMILMLLLFMMTLVLLIMLMGLFDFRKTSINMNIWIQFLTQIVSYLTVR